MEPWVKSVSYTHLDVYKRQVGSHAGLDRTIPGATAEGSIRQQEVIVAEAAEDEVANRRSEGSGALSAESVGASAAQMCIRDSYI